MNQELPGLQFTHTLQHFSISDSRQLSLGTESLRVFHYSVRKVGNWGVSAAAYKCYSVFVLWGKCRDESRTRLIQLKDKAVKELAQHEIEIKELCRTLEHDRRIRDFIAIKLQERMLTEEALKAKRKQGV